ncbi:uncharacterized protein PAC_15468 [Phialocephala subalpina]|uniref:Fumarylacetoacetase-like C-terminal domain-containing protein n=1 Tax=Phialocephala subalpina TaxID=576137 RepID=A0A1L7XKM0_9HELO|nr:uncharacterized protein PAC_15468 [Phialocephala subalpina]
MMGIEGFVRFSDEKGEIAYGELHASATSGQLTGVEVELLSGSPFTGLSRTGAQATIQKVHYPLTVPSYPVVFTKPADALAGPYDDIPINRSAQSQLDYEGELTVIISKDCKNVSDDQALDYVLGYTVGNDVSAQNFQVPTRVSGGQFSYAKSFDPSRLLGHVLPFRKRLLIRRN